MESPEQYKAIMKGRICPYCQKKTKVRRSEYDSNELVRICIPCDAYVSCHKGTPNALGRLANKGLRIRRIDAHEVFDSLWKRKAKKGFTLTEARKLAYEWLSKELELPRAETHIAMFGPTQCTKVIKLCMPYYRDKKNKKKKKIKKKYNL